MGPVRQGTRVKYTLLRAVLVIAAMILAACYMDEPFEFGGFTARTETQSVFQDQTQEICTALEDAGYIMPYGSPFGWYEFNIRQSHWILEGPEGNLLSLPQGEPHLYVLADWSIPADFNSFPDAVSTDTVDVIAAEAKNICRIVQREAQRYGIGSIAVHISLRDLIVGTMIEYDVGSPNSYTSDCEAIVGFYTSKSIGLNPQERTPGVCPSLYVPN